MQPLTISMPNPCTQHQTWSAMQPTNDGRFCQNCEKTVVDFTKMLDEEMLAYLSNFKSGELCGRFKSSQLNRTVQSPEIQLDRRENPFWKMAIASLALGGWLAINAPNAHAASLPNIPPQETIKMGMEVPKIQSGSTLQGIVLDRKTKKPLRGIEVELRFKNEKIVGGRTDENGMFELDIDYIEIDVKKCYLELARRVRVRSESLHQRTRRVKKVAMRNFKGTILFGKKDGKKYTSHLMGCPAF